jgi:hypothetical protein
MLGRDAIAPPPDGMLRENDGALRGALWTLGARIWADGADRTCGEAPPYERVIGLRCAEPPDGARYVGALRIAERGSPRQPALGFCARAVVRGWDR